MKIKITIRDAENGQVRVDSDPDMKILAAMARARDLTPAAGYALGALAKIIKDSQAQATEAIKERFENGEIPMYDSSRRMFT